MDASALDRLVDRLTPPVALALAALVSAAMLVTALLFQYVGGLFPCELCILQRIPYGAVIGIGAVGAVLTLQSRRPTPLAFLFAGAVALLFLVDAGIAGFHVGVEQGWWHGTESCVGEDIDTSSIEAMRAAILAAPAVRCDEIAWQMLGISMAGWNGLAALGLAAATLVVLLRWRRA